MLANNYDDGISSKVVITSLLTMHALRFNLGSSTLVKGIWRTRPH